MPEELKSFLAIVIAIITFVVYKIADWRRESKRKKRTEEKQSLQNNNDPRNTSSTHYTTTPDAISATGAAVSLPAQSSASPTEASPIVVRGCEFTSKSNFRDDERSARVFCLICGLICCAVSLLIAALNLINSYKLLESLNIQSPEAQIKKYRLYETISAACLGVSVCVTLLTLIFSVKLYRSLGFLAGIICFTILAVHYLIIFFIIVFGRPKSRSVICIICTLVPICYLIYTLLRGEGYRILK